MSDDQDQQSLLYEQYKDASNLNKRFEIIQRLQRSQADGYRWIFDHFDLTSPGPVLELGCGTGLLWLQNSERIPSAWDITLSDFSAGMLQETQQALSTSPHHFTFRVIDAHALPFADASFDLIIANNMLYHLTDLSTALTEIRRVLKPGGYLYATAPGGTAMTALERLGQQADVSLATDGQRFSLANGATSLLPYFARVELQLVDEPIIFTEADQLIAMLQSLTPATVSATAQFQQIRDQLAREQAEQGALNYQMDYGCFTASGKK